MDVDGLMLMLGLVLIDFVMDGVFVTLIEMETVLLMLGVLLGVTDTDCVFKHGEQNSCPGVGLRLTSGVSDGDGANGTAALAFSNNPANSMRLTGLIVISSMVSGNPFFSNSSIIRSNRV